MMYRYADKELYGILEFDDSGNVTRCIPSDPANTDYQILLNNKTPINDFIPPLMPPPLTTKQKLEIIGINKAELQIYLGIIASI